MSKHVLFIQGAGAGAHEADAKLAASLKRELGADYEVRYPKMPDEEDADYSVWTARIAKDVAELGEGVILVGHSIGASVLIKALADGALKLRPAGVFLVAAPFWHDHKVWRWKEAELPEDAGARLSGGPPLFFYHGREDETAPFEHLGLYAKAFPKAVVRSLAGRDHQLNEDLSEVAEDVRRLRTP